MRRLIAQVRPQRKSGALLPEAEGPTLLCTAAVHGNEPSGIAACCAVAERLRALPRGGLRGEFVALVGNCRARERGVRYIHEDLNRHFTPQQFRRAHDLAAASHGGEEGDELRPMLAEDRELVELTAAVRNILDRARGPVALLDLHTTSADSPPFLALEDRGPSRRLASVLPVPAVVGIEEVLDGLLISWFNTAGKHPSGAALVFEAARHDDPGAVARHEAAIYLAMHGLEMLDAEAAPELVGVVEGAREALSPLGAGLPREMEPVHRHAVVEGSRFVMRPGYENFGPVHRGEELARDKGGAIRAVASGRVFMPLYQEQGDDGFFIVRRVRRWAALASLASRALHLERFVRFLPGVRRAAPAGVDAFAARGWAARWYRRVFRGLGYRRVRRLSAGWVLIARSADDLAAAHVKAGRPGRRG